MDITDILQRLANIEARLQNSDFDNDGFSPATGDCDDSNFEVNPNATEISGDGIDNDCNGVIDGDLIDNDGDGFNSIATGGNDCDDNEPLVNPGQTDFFADSRLNGSWDYNCNNVDEMEYPGPCNSIVTGGELCWDNNLVPSCGQTGNVTISFTSPSVILFETQTQRCR